MVKLTYFLMTVRFTPHSCILFLNIDQKPRKNTPCSKTNRRACMSLRKQKPGLRDNVVSPTLTSPWKEGSITYFFLNPCQYTTDSSKFFITQLITITESLGNVFVRHWHFQFKRLPHPFVQTSLTITIEDYTINRTILIDQIMRIWK